MPQKRTPKPEKKQRMRVGKLESLPQLAKFQARTIKKAAREGGGAVNDCYKLVMLASMLAKTLELTELDRRISALEEKYKQITS